MVTTTRTRPSEDTAVDTQIGRRRARPDGVFARPEVLAAKAAPTGARARPTPRPLESTWRRYLAGLLRLPPALIDWSQPEQQTRPDTAAAIGVGMRRRDDPNP